MADAIDPANLPAGMDAYAGYVDGRWPDYQAEIQKFPAAHHLSISAFATDDSDCLDIETGDATNAQAGPWVARQRANGAGRPCVYTSLSNAQALIATLDGVGVPRASYRLWLAHYTNTAHICSPACGLGFTDIADGTQWTDHGGVYDESLLDDTFFTSPTQEETEMLLVYTPSEGIWFLSGSLYVYVDAPDAANSAAAAGVKSWTVSEKIHQELLAASQAHAAPAAPPPTATGSAAISGQITFS